MGFGISGRLRVREQKRAFREKLIGSAGERAMTRSIPVREAAMLKPHGGSRAPSGSEKLFAGPGVSQFVFIDTDVPDIDCLLFGLEPHTRTCVLNRSPDALDQIADILAQCGALEAVHIV